ncbi:MAG: YggT family protein [Anaerolineales bacterium]|nr:YggT family protein [Anaerolineales bacterium]
MIQLIDVAVRLFVLLILAHIVLSYFMDPFHPVRRQVDRIVEPMLTPIRRVVPLVGMIDFSPLVLLISVQFVGMIVTSILRSFL